MHTVRYPEPSDLIETCFLDFSDTSKMTIVLLYTVMNWHVWQCNSMKVNYPLISVPVGLNLVSNSLRFDSGHVRFDRISNHSLILSAIHHHQ